MAKNARSENVDHDYLVWQSCQHNPLVISLDRVSHLVMIVRARATPYDLMVSVGWLATKLGDKFV